MSKTYAVKPFEITRTVLQIGDTIFYNKFCVYVYLMHVCMLLRS